jgi:hypothetical protein
MILKYDIQDIELIEKRDIVLDALLVQSLENHMARAICGIAGAAYGCLAEVSGVTSESSLINQAVGSSAERQAAVFKVIDSPDGIICQNDSRILICQVVAAFDRIKGVPLGSVLFQIAQSSSDPALSRSGMGAHRMELGQHGCFSGFAGF